MRLLSSDKSTNHCSRPIGGLTKFYQSISTLILNQYSIDYQSLQGRGLVRFQSNCRDFIHHQPKVMDAGTVSVKLSILCVSMNVTFGASRIYVMVEGARLVMLQILFIFHCKRMIRFYQQLKRSKNEQR